jgi:ABC-type thiamin/hydroxymethylpyrimidine transport system permease subunit
MGLIASSLIGAVYFSPFSLLFKQVRIAKFNDRSAISIIKTLFGVSIAAVIGSIMSGNQTFMMLTKSVLVLVAIIISAIFTAKVASKLISKLIQKSKIISI